MTQARTSRFDDDRLIVSRCDYRMNADGWPLNFEREMLIQGVPDRTRYDIVMVEFTKRIRESRFLSFEDVRLR